jgi:NAD(P)-dependent dehydrogenase (short-subunit alcohol dehydrogenase family)
MFRVRSDGRACFYSPTILGVGVLFFVGLCYTIRMAEKIALVTGASSGFGLLTSIELRKAGFRVVATMQQSRTGVGAMVDIRVLDVTKLDAIQGSVDAVVRDYGRLDVVVNNAGRCVGLRGGYQA